MTRRHFFSMFTAAVVSAVGAVSMRKTLPKLYISRDGKNWSEDLPPYLNDKKHWLYYGMKRYTPMR